jgi:hypothetical protein
MAHVRFVGEDLLALVEESIDVAGPVGVQVEQNVEALVGGFRQLCRDLPSADLEGALADARRRLGLDH